jgi:alpha-amylase/alpha-mannosidase (GH57 family)
MKYICVHGHFYQPPREHPWLEAIELQDSAYPYHDWNERITAECYSRNAASRIADAEGRILEIVNNYSKISFNFGPTLLSWAEENSPPLYAAILQADRDSATLFGGHGSALAQAYNHMIMPLANPADKYTQAFWGTKDFERRFGRFPEGMWLPETAVDIPTLEILAQLGFGFTILAPRQAAKVRRIGSRNWEDVSGDQIDPTQAYRLRLPSGQSIALFFYDGPISRAVAFEGMLNSGETFAQRLMGAFSDARERPQIVHIATDGESYGHHHRYGEMALTYALHYIESNKLAELTNYGRFLELHPPTHEVQIFENTSWSCIHGVERWRTNCGCNSGRVGWNQEWRAPLRTALDLLRDAVAPRFEEAARALLQDPWAARNDYIEVILDRSPEKIEEFLGRHASHNLSPEEKIAALKLLEMQRHAMLMYTSCGWFFDELSGIETVQVIQYAGRVVHLAQQLFGTEFESQFLQALSQAKSNLPEHGDGARIYEKWVKPAVVDLEKVAAHYAISSLFEAYGDHTRIYSFSADRTAYSSLDSGSSRLAVGRGRFTSRITRESAELTFAVIHFGDHNINGGIRNFEGLENFEALERELTAGLSRGDIPEVIRVLDREFGHIYSLPSMFRDEQRKIIGLVLDSALGEANAAYHAVYEHHATLIRFLTSLGVPTPKALQASAEFALNRSLREAFKSEVLDLPRIRGLFDEAATLKVTLDVPTLEYALRRRIEQIARKTCENPADPQGLENLEAAVSLARGTPLNVSFWEVQNICLPKLAPAYREISSKSAENGAQEWLRLADSLAENLSLRIAPAPTS